MNRSRSRTCPLAASLRSLLPAAGTSRPAPPAACGGAAPRLRSDPPGGSNSARRRGVGWELEGQPAGEKNTNDPKPGGCRRSLGCSF